MKGRFAPTPSGYMHLGNAFAALLCWLSVRSRQGHLVLRVEDLDRQRSRPEYVDALLQDLTWLGLHWDEGPLFQSERSSFYASSLSELAQNHLLYPCVCTRAQLNAASAPHQSDACNIYNGRCRSLQEADISFRAAAVRVRVPEKNIALKDGCQGLYEQNLQINCGDFILRRSDGVYAYQLATPVDDGLMQITEVVRGRDLLSSAPRQIWLMQTLGFSPPQFFHIPMLLSSNGRRLAKRDGDLEISALRQNGWHPSRLIGLLAFWAGILPKWEDVAAQDLIAVFNWDKIRKKDVYLPVNFPHL